VRDLFKEWKIALSDGGGDRLSTAYHTMQLQDLDRLAASMVRLLKPLVAATAALVEQASDNAGAAPTVSPAFHSTSGFGGSGRNLLYGGGGGGGGGGLHTLRRGMSSSGAMAAASSVAALLNESARSAFLAPIHPHLRVLHRSILRQYEQATLTCSLAKGLSESFIQRGRDKANDTLYILTVVSVIVTPLQIMAGVYGMNFDNFPELHYENAYYWFWGQSTSAIHAETRCKSGHWDRDPCSTSKRRVWISNSALDCTAQLDAHMVSAVVFLSHVPTRPERHGHYRHRPLVLAARARLNLGRDVDASFSGILMHIECSFLLFISLMFKCFNAPKEPRRELARHWKDIAVFPQPSLSLPVAIGGLKRMKKKTEHSSTLNSRHASLKIGALDAERSPHRREPGKRGGKVLRDSGVAILTA
jgi:hypothetical protein